MSLQLLGYFWLCFWGYFRIYFWGYFGIFWDIPALQFLWQHQWNKLSNIFNVFYFDIFTIWKFGWSTKDYWIWKQRPALQSLREEHFCQLALQVVTKQVLFSKYFHPFNSNFLCESANVSILKGGGAEVKYMFSSHKSQFSRSIFALSLLGERIIPEKSDLSHARNLCTENVAHA